MRSRHSLPAPGRVLAEDADLAGVGRAEALQDLDGGGLAGAVGPENGDDLAAVDLEVDAAHDLAVAVGLAQAADADHRRALGAAGGRGDGRFEGVREHAGNPARRAATRHRRTGRT